MSRPHGALGAAVATALALAAVGCGGIGEQTRAERINPDDLDGRLVERVTSTTTAPGTPDPTDPAGVSDPPAAPIIEFFYIEGDRIVAVPVEVGPDTSLRALLTELEGDPLAIGEGFRSELPGGLISGIYRLHERVTVNLDGEIFAATDARDHRLLFGQIVLTLIRLPEPYPQFTAVRFTVDDEPIAVPLRDNTLSERGGWVTWEDYERLLEPT